MDLRPYLKDTSLRSVPHNPLFERGMKLIQNAELWYQPFILADGVEVGEGQNLEENYRNTHSVYDHNVFLSSEHLPYWNGNPRKLATDGAYFRACNEKYRFGYDLLADRVVARAGGDISNLSFLEVGCNTGLNLFNLAVRGAKSCVGVDWTDHGSAFDWLNAVLKTRVQYLKGSYDNLIHTIPGVNVPPADVVLNTIFLNHQCDPIEALCYFADHASKALCLWVLLTDRGDEMSVSYGRVAGMHDLGVGKPLPLSFQNDVSFSTALLKECLARLGFEDVEIIDLPENVEDKLTSSLVPFRMVWARRTHRRPSAFACLDGARLEPEMIARRVRAAEDAARRAKELASDLERELRVVRKSYSFRLGRAMLWPARQARRVLRVK